MMKRPNNAELYTPVNENIGTQMTSGKSSIAAILIFICVAVPRIARGQEAEDLGSQASAFFSALHGMKIEYSEHRDGKPFCDSIVWIHGSGKGRCQRLQQINASNGARTVKWEHLLNDQCQYVSRRELQVPGATSARRLRGSLDWSQSALSLVDTFWFGLIWDGTGWLDLSQSDSFESAIVNQNEGSVTIETNSQAEIAVQFGSDQRIKSIRMQRQHPETRADRAVVVSSRLEFEYDDNGDLQVVRNIQLMLDEGQQQERAHEFTVSRLSRLTDEELESNQLSDNDALNGRAVVIPQDESAYEYRDGLIIRKD